MCVIVVAFVLLVTSFGWMREAEGEAKIPVGVVLPMSGPFAVAGKLCKYGYDLAVEDINKAGGIKSLGGAQLELVYGDHQGKQDVAIGETERLAQQEKVVAFMGSWHSPSTVAATQAAERLRVPWIVEVASADVIVERGFKYVVRVNVKGTWYGEAGVDFLDYLRESSSWPKVERVAIMYTDDDWGRSSVGTGAKEALKNRDYQIVEDIAYPGVTQDVTTYISKIKAARPDAFIITSFPNDALLVGRAVEKLELKVPVAIGVSAGYVQPQFRGNLGPLAERWFVVAGWNSDIAGAKPLAESYKAKYNEDFSEHSALAYQAALVLKEAIESAGSTDRDKINEALHRVVIEPGPRLVMPFEKIEFDQTGQNSYARELILQIREGKLVTVWPEKYASQKALLPFR
jgi:branched-chain amino acid transport system substrate-binding protein